MIVAWLKANKLLIAGLSVLGSLAGIGISIADLHTEMKRKRLVK
jgi:hypothetical protein